MSGEQVAPFPGTRFLTSIMHRFMRWVSRRGLRWFYRDVGFTGTERIPDEGPVLLVANHPNDLTDVMMVLLSTHRPVRFVATATAAASLPVRWAYEGMGVIPVTRVRDARKMRERGVDVAAANRTAFTKVTDVLAAGGMVALFPEGGVHAGPDIGTLRSGVARLAIDCVASGAVGALQVIPVGSQYESAHRAGSDANGAIGRPLLLDSWIATASGKPHATFTVEVRRMMQGVCRTAPTTDEALQRDRILAAAGASIAAPEERPMAAAGRIHHGWARLAMHPLAASAASRICDATTAAGGSAVSALDCRRVLLAASEPHTGTTDAPDRRSHDRSAPSPVWRLALQAPFAGLGFALHAPVFALISMLSRRLSTSNADVAARAIIPGLYLIFVWYAVLAAALAAALRWSPWGNGVAFPMVLLLVVGFLAALPRLGDAAIQWPREWMGHRLAARVRRLTEQQRADLRTSMRTLRDACASHIQDPAVTSAVTSVVTSSVTEQAGVA
ncbi:MAG TPA: lysophospholipid acyltransferase family protein [Gemmatimonas sp.]|nr:lysophospholipid acyltransferase family protein [Gemmatimonas sp.]